MSEFISTSKANILRNAITSGIREDERDIFNIRNLRVLFNKELNCTEVTLGHTKVYAKIDAIITEPRIDRQNEGMVEFKVDLSCLQSIYSPKQLKEKSSEMVKILEKSLKSSKSFNKGIGYGILEHQTRKVLLENPH